MDLEQALKKIEELEKEVDKTGVTLATANRKIDSLTKDLAAANSESAGRRIEIKRLETENKELKNSSNPDETLQKQLDDVTAERDALKEKETARAEATKTAYEKRLEGMKDEHKELIPDFGDDYEKAATWLDKATERGLFGKEGIKPKQAGDGNNPDMSGWTPQQKRNHARAQAT